MRRRTLQRLALTLIGLTLVAGCPSADRDRILTRGEKLYSQFNEELIIRHFFDDRRNGFFVDVGAYHWKNYSTTYYLEKHLDWSGIAIDAQGGFAAGYRNNRPRSRFFRFIVTDHSGTMETLYLAGPVSSIEKRHVSDLDPRAQDIELREVQVPTITLNELLDRNGVSRIDFLSMDIEQAEPKALSGFDIERFRPELVCIEAFPPIRDRIAAYFATHGYERIEAYLRHDEHNWYYTPRR
jgi:FkbM family methyltransferase